MKILIFTQDRELLNVLREETKRLLFEARQEAKILSFYSYDSTIDELSASYSDYDLAVLDIDHIQDLRQIYTKFRVHNLIAAMIIISSSYSRLDAAMLLRPTAYLKKPLAQQQFGKRVQFVLNEFSSSGRFFSYKRKQKLEKINYSDIEYFESNQRNITLFEKGNDIHTFTAKLDDIQGKVDETSFVRCHQSYLVNLQNVKFLDRVNRQFHMESGRTVDISRRSMPEIIERFDSYMENKRI